MVFILTLSQTIYFAAAGAVDGDLHDTLETQPADINSNSAHTSAHTLVSWYTSQYLVLC